jgi:hypothetical protein
LGVISENGISSAEGNGDGASAALSSPNRRFVITAARFAARRPACCRQNDAEEAVGLVQQGDASFGPTRVRLMLQARA